MDTMSKHSGRLELTWTDKDKTLLSTGDGKYDYTFVDPSDYRVSEVRLLHELARVDAPDSDERPAGLPSPTSDNLLITGDAMHVLDSLAKIPEYAKSYVGKVKLVYIDPPFNTGQAFTNYEDNIEHSIWLTMLRDRLRQLAPLLADNGSVWVHLDDVEVHRCRAIMDEELGADNFVAEVVWQKADSPRSDAKGLSISHDSILVYRKSSAWTPNRVARLASTDAAFGNQDGDPVLWRKKDPTAPGGSTHQGMVYAVQHPISGGLVYPGVGRHWAMEQNWMLTEMSRYADYEKREIDDADARARVCGLTAATVRTGVQALMLAEPLDQAAKRATEVYEAGTWPTIYLTGPGGSRGLQRKGHISDTGRVPETWWTHAEVGHNRSAKNEIKALFPGTHPFATPKPERLLERIVQVATNPGDIVLDCFAGSGTTAAVAHKMGRRWATSELLPETADAYTVPRLTKVVQGLDDGGITSSTDREAAANVELPDGVSPGDAQKFQTMLGKVLDDSDQLMVDMGAELAKRTRALAKSGASALDADETKTLLALLKKFGTVDGAGDLDTSPAVKTKLTARTKTRDVTTTRWHGGGGFTHLRVGESMFVDFDGIILLADWATQSALTQAMCAQLSVAHEPDGIFAGRKGRTRYVVLDGLVGTTTVASIVDQLSEREIVQVWATQLGDGASEALRESRPGSRLEAIPDQVLDTYRRKAGNRSPFGPKADTKKDD